MSEAWSGADRGHRRASSPNAHCLVSRTGVLIEANPALCEGLRAHRSRASSTLCTGVSADFRTMQFERGMYTSTFAASDVIVDARKSGVKPKLIRRRGSTAKVPSHWAAPQLGSCTSSGLT